MFFVLSMFIWGFCFVFPCSDISGVKFFFHYYYSVLFLDIKMDIKNVRELMVFDRSHFGCISLFRAIQMIIRMLGKGIWTEFNFMNCDLKMFYDSYIVKGY